MKLRHREENNICIIEIEGEITFGHTSEIGPFFLLLTNIDYEGFIINLNKVDYVDTTGLGFLCSFYKRGQQQQTRVTLCQINEEIRWIFKNHLVPIYETEVEALASFKETVPNQSLTQEVLLSCSS